MAKHKAVLTSCSPHDRNKETWAENCCWIWSLPGDVRSSWGDGDFGAQCNVGGNRLRSFQACGDSGEDRGKGRDTKPRWISCLWQHRISGAGGVLVSAVGCALKHNHCQREAFQSATRWWHCLTRVSKSQAKMAQGHSSAHNVLKIAADFLLFASSFDPPADHRTKHTVKWLS